LIAQTKPQEPAPMTITRPTALTGHADLRAG